LTRNGLGYILGDFLKNSSGRPDSNRRFENRNSFRTDSMKWPGTNVMILKIFSPKNWRFWLKINQNCAKIWSFNQFLRKTPLFRRKLPKIAENCNHNVDARNSWYFEAFLEWGYVWILKPTMLEVKMKTILVI
jgi:hypothetical protein